MKTLLACLLFSLLMPLAHAADAIDDLTVLAEAGDAEAQFALGQKYQRGEGVTKDTNAAVQWYSKAADLGSVDAKFRLGLLYKNGRYVDKDPERGFEYIKNAAELGDPYAQFTLGTMYLEGVGVDSNVASALRWLTTSAEQGEYFAQNTLGEIYSGGLYGQARDWQKATVWLKKMTETKDEDLRNLELPYLYLAFIYHEGGYGVSQDTGEAMKWFAASGTNLEKAPNFFVQAYAWLKSVESQ